MLSTADYIVTKPDRNRHTVNLKYLPVACICWVTWPSLSLQWPKYISPSLPPSLSPSLPTHPPTYLLTYLPPNLPSYLPVQVKGPARLPRSRLRTKCFAEISTRSYERAGWPGCRDLGNQAKIFAIWTHQPGYRDENYAMQSGICWKFGRKILNLY